MDYNVYIFNRQILVVQIHIDEITKYMRQIM